MKRFLAMAISLAFASATGAVAAQDYSDEYRYEYEHEDSTRADYAAEGELAADHLDDQDHALDDGDRYDERDQGSHDPACEPQKVRERRVVAPIVGALFGALVGRELGHGWYRSETTVAGAALGYRIGRDVADHRCGAYYPRSRRHGYGSPVGFGYGGIGSNGYSGFGGYGPGLSIVLGASNWGYGFHGWNGYHYRRHGGRHQRDY